jgi:hypothetical protein
VDELVHGSGSSFAVQRRASRSGPGASANRTAQPTRRIGHEIPVAMPALLVIIRLSMSVLAIVSKPRMIGNSELPTIRSGTLVLEEITALVLR